MAAGIKFHPAGGDLIQVQLGVENSLTVPNWLDQIVAVGIHDTAAAPAHPAASRLLFRSIRPIRARIQGQSRTGGRQSHS